MKFKIIILSLLIPILVMAQPYGNYWASSASSYLGGGNTYIEYQFDITIDPAAATDDTLTTWFPLKPTTGTRFVSTVFGNSNYSINPKTLHEIGGNMLEIVVRFTGSSGDSIGGFSLIQAEFAYDTTGITFGNIDDSHIVVKDGNNAQATYDTWVFEDDNLEAAAATATKTAYASTYAIPVRWISGNWVRFYFTPTTETNQSDTDYTNDVWTATVYIIVKKG